MRISCPYCGERWNDEFSVLGDADALIQRPDSASLDAFHAYVYVRDNPAGRHRELWYHQAGCRQYVVVERDTRSHAIYEVTSARDYRCDHGAP